MISAIYTLPLSIHNSPDSIVKHLLMKCKRSFGGAMAWNVQILRCAQDDSEAKACHPERSEGLERVEFVQRFDNPTTIREAPK
jgi:hypothetical protein